MDSLVMETKLTNPKTTTQMSSSRLISFPEDFDPAQPALAPNALVPELAGPGLADFCPLPALEGPDVASAPSSITSSASSADTIISQFTPGESAGASSTIDPAALAAAAGPPTSSNNRSLSRQTSATFRTAAVSANAGSRGKTSSAGPASTAPVAAPPITNAGTAAYFHLGMSPTPSSTEAAAAHRGRHNDNELALANAVHGLGDDARSERRINREQNEETRLMITEARINAAEEMRKLSVIQLADHNVLARLLNAVNAVQRDVSALRTIGAPTLAPLPMLVDPIPLPPPSSAPFLGATMGPPASEASSSRTRTNAPTSYDDAPPAKRQRTGGAHDEPFDVYFYDVAQTGEPRDMARAAMSAIDGLNSGSVLNAIRVRGKAATISIRFRTRPFALTFIDAIENCPPANFEGLHACWAPAMADPIALIRGEGFSGRSASG
ncbi:hypothetical protein C8F04DRAFT_1101514 [Mycena alexandri]|uniref:Uncharacterized protein n=1 Tax=Mycena alexandri TaxID=1745969 RepID=A0AAD6X3V3_9AGAR|nr:hypothetical protein C8F04DRAFT_1101514 [Mycena alexandri]